MKKRKKILKFLLICLLIGSFAPGIAVDKVYAESEQTITDIIDLTGIVRDKSGDYISKSQYVTREEFAQMLIQASPDSQFAGNVKFVQLFKDVKKSNSKASYIQAAATRGYISGYLDGTFGPKKAVTIKDAIFGTLALLGYTNEDFAGNISMDRSARFKDLGLGKNISREESYKLTSKDCETLFYNLLNSKKKSGEIYATVLGLSVNEDGKVDYAGLLDKKTKGPFLTTKGWEKNLSNKLPTYRIYQNNIEITANQIGYCSVAYSAEKVNKLWIYNKKVFGVIDNVTYASNKPQDISIDGVTYPVENPAEMRNMVKDAGIKKGMLVVLLLGREDKASYLLPISSTIAKENWQQKLPFDLGIATIYKNGSKIARSAIDSTDVIYYSNELKTLWVYGKQTYGTVESISPSVSAPQEIVVAGKKYQLDLLPVNYSDMQNSEDLTGNSWGVRLNDNGIKVGDNVVILFGYNGTVADICKVDKMPVTISGYVINVGNKVIKNEDLGSSVKRAIQIVDTDGTVREFSCADPMIVNEAIVEITFSNGKVNITKIESGSNIVDLSDTEMPKIAEDARIIEVNGVNYTEISVTDFRDSGWSKTNIIYYKMNKEKEITDLIVRNITNTFYRCGFLKSVEYPDGVNSYTRLTFEIDGKEITYAVDVVKWSISLGPKAILIKDNLLMDMQELQNVRISYISNNQANTGDAVYRLADNVQVYFYKDGHYYLATLEDVVDYEKNTVYGYLDNSRVRIRLIVVSN